MVERMTVSLEKELVEELKRLARQEGKSVSGLVREAIELHLTHERKKRLGEELLRTVNERLVNERKALEELKRIRREWQERGFLKEDGKAALKHLLEERKKDNEREEIRF